MEDSPQRPAVDHPLLSCGRVGTLRPKYATPHVAVITLGLVAAALIILGSMGGTAQQIYRIFVSLEIITYFIPYLYMFAALLTIVGVGLYANGKLRRRRHENHRLALVERIDSLRSLVEGS